MVAKGIWRNVIGSVWGFHLLTVKVNLAIKMKGKYLSKYNYIGRMESNTEIQFPEGENNI